MNTFTRAGLFFAGIFWFMAGPVEAEPVPYLGKSRIVNTWNANEGTGTLRISSSGSTNAYGKYTCTGSASSTADTSGSCGEGFLGISVSAYDLECSSETIDYYITRVDSHVNCTPLTCYSPDPPYPLLVGCSYDVSYTGTLEGAGFTGSLAATATSLVTWESNDGATFRTRWITTEKGEAGIEFIEEPPANDAHLEIPAPGSTVNGVGVITGWSCIGGEMKAEIIDAGEVVDTVVISHGTQRTDTEEVCGDSDNGFGATVNWNHYTEGEKTIRFFQNEELITSRDFSILRLSDDEFLTGASGMCVVNNFPTAGQETTVEWDESRQGFFPTSTRASQ